MGGRNITGTFQDMVGDFVFKNHINKSISPFLTKFLDSGNVLWKYKVVEEESDFHFKNKNNKFRRPLAKNEEKLPQKNIFCFRSFFFLFVDWIIGLSVEMSYQHMTVFKKSEPFGGGNRTTIPPH